jgi:tetratricopeptide (TPR) repeat protein
MEQGGCMKAHFFGCAVFIAMTSHFLPAQVTKLDELTSAAHLNQEGKFSEAVQLTEHMTSSTDSRDDVAGVAWNIRGLALENLGDWDGARRSYETSLEILRSTQAPIKQYASALNNLGSLKADLGDLEESYSLRMRALKLYRSINDHSGVARSSLNLALVALAQRDRKRARRSIAEARKEEALVTDPKQRELAALRSVEAVEYAREGHMTEALNAINDSIKLWSDGHGSNYYLLGTALCLRGQIDASSRNWDQAQADLTRALDILKMNHAPNTKAFFVAEKAYAVVLRAQGNSDEAEQIARDADRGLQELRKRQCTECTISVESFR